MFDCVCVFNVVIYLRYNKREYFDIISDKLRHMSAVCACAWLPVSDSARSASSITSNTPPCTNTRWSSACLLLLWKVLRDKLQLNSVGGVLQLDLQLVTVSFLLLLLLTCCSFPVLKVNLCRHCTFICDNCLIALKAAF